MLEYIYDHIEYPKVVIEEEIIGTTVVQFIVKNNGQIEFTRIARSIHPDADIACKELVESMPEWRAGRHLGLQVNVLYTVPIHFRLDNY